MSITQYNVSDLIKNIYILPKIEKLDLGYEVGIEQGPPDSVFIEFHKKSSWPHACENISKSPELNRDLRIPTLIKDNPCFGFRGLGTSSETLIQSIVYWMRDDWGQGFKEVDSKIQRIFVQASDLEYSKKNMPVKDYEELFPLTEYLHQAWNPELVNIK